MGGRPAWPSGRAGGGGSLPSGAARGAQVGGEQAVPGAAGAQDELDHLADGATAAGPGEDVVDAAADVGDGVGGGEGEAAGEQHRQVDEIVAQVGDPASGGRPRRPQAAAGPGPFGGGPEQ